MLLDFYEERINWIEPGRDNPRDNVDDSSDVAVRPSREVEPADSQHGHGANIQGKTDVIFIKLHICKSLTLCCIFKAL